MRARLLVILGVTALALAGCETYPGPTANCFAFAADAHPCDFQAVAGAEGVRP